MNPIPFDESEMTILDTYPARGSNPALPRLNTPITPRENLLMLYRGETPLWIPQFVDVKPFAPDVMPENRVRGMVNEVEKVSPDLYGGTDMFGVDWIFDPVIRGSMVRPGNPKVPDIARWEECVTLPDPDSWDWAGSAQKNRSFIERGWSANAMRLTIYTGFFERLISFMDFEEAAIAMIDEESQEDVHRLFDYLADLYIKIIGHAVEAFPVNIVQLHDDWGSQMAPFFALDTVREMIVPHMKKVSDFCHSKGLFFDQHSCGMNARLVPAMIEAGVDSWQPQMINDTWDICRTYGDKIIINVIPKNTEKGLADAEYDAMAKAWVDDNIELFRTHPFILLPNPMDPFGTTYVDPKFVCGIYKYSRIALSK